MKRLSGAILYFYLTLVAVNAFAVVNASPVTTISSVTNYNNFPANGGDVVVYVNAGFSGCNTGFYISQNDPAFKSQLALIMSVKMSGSNIVYLADTAQLWSGGVPEVCHLYAITVE
jgi:hypothetical protein